MDLGFDLHLAGRASKPVTAETVRELTPSDLALLAVERGIKPTHVQRITARHHALARCLATGMSATEAGLITGYTGSRISVLKGDPAFEELIAHYTGLKGEAVLDYQEQLVALRTDATIALHERVSETPEAFSPSELLDVAKFTADRTGHGAASKTTNVNVNLGMGDRLREARERSSALQSSPESLRPVSPERGAICHESPLAPLTIEGEFTEVASDE